MSVENVTDASFDVDVKMSDVPVIVDFWAPWCGPCKQISPALELISEEMQGKIKVVKINVDENPETAARLGVRGIPALFIFDEGEVISNMTGAKPIGAIKGWIADALA
jgi:thioredoxin 1